MKETTKDYLEFCAELKELLNEDDFLTENVRTADFLEAMQAWLIDTKGGDDFFETPQEHNILWDDLIKLIRASAMYE